MNTSGHVTEDTREVAKEKTLLGFFARLKSSVKDWKLDTTHVRVYFQGLKGIQMTTENFQVKELHVFEAKVFKDLSGDRPTHR